MARQRFVKPDFFQHDDLHRAELVSALPLRVAYIGLWCQCDRRGLFEWKPSRLKLNVLPFDDVDFEAVLNALETAGFIRSYVVNGERFGCVPTFAKHQTFHVREQEAKHIPAPPQPSASTGPALVPAPGSHGASTPVTVTGTATVTVTGLPPAAEPGSWVEAARQQWAAKVGPVAHGRIGKACKELVDAHGWDAVSKALADYLCATPTSRARLDYFAERGTYWVNLAKTPLFDPVTSQPTERYRVTVEGKAA